MSLVHDAGARALRLLDPETAHELTLAALRAGLGPVSREGSDPILSSRLAGLFLPNPIGLAPGFDKNAGVVDPLLRVGFGFIECGAVTPRPQPGNPRPRLFRLSEDRAVINRMGFNNAGVEAFAEGLALRKSGGVVGVNLGANKDSPDRSLDYVACLRRLWPLAQFFTLNVSSPNTPGLRNLQSEGALTALLAAVAEARSALASGPDGDRPLFLKVAPDLAESDVEPFTETAVAFGVNGLIVSNTTLARAEDLRSRHRGEAGGLSGAPLFARSTALLASFHAASAGRLSLIGVGGVCSGRQAYAKILAGANAIQLYTALVYEGPGLVARINRDLAALLRADGFASVSAAVGAGGKAGC